MTQSLASEHGEIGGSQAPVPDSPAWWRSQPHEHEIEDDRRSGPPFCRICWQVFDVVTGEPIEGDGR